MSFRRLLVAAIALLSFNSALSASNLVMLQIGPIWPNDLLSQQSSTAWDAGILTGKVIDKKVGFGGAFDFLWNHRVSEQQIAAGAYQINEDVKTFMFPITGFVMISPLPQLIVSPCLWVHAGLNTMYYSNSRDSTINVTNHGTLATNGWYMGFICKIAADAQYHIGENSSLFMGVEYQWNQNSELRTPTSSTSNIEIKCDMSGFGIRAGFTAIY